MIPESQFRCLVASSPPGAKVADDAVHTPKLAWNDESGEATDGDRSILFWRSEAEAKTAAGANMVALLIIIIRRLVWPIVDDSLYPFLASACTPQ